ncbi:hypothetical protein JCM19046_1091 [Bacillus sp. JCM 19046]|uniref:Uncharacterized protein n=1 Tax=Shouchella xiaoxiensis TaxID=766895 RepID=A0ABS2SXV6_9BACI|nr:hypothetical protein [Shouchella xiaoxiensis]MBM7840367.1 hypothetical protein [Shouchella xiaoxiensis]GAF16643.1 hypothetical protein JCM19046_1091 [Bacillus sp. JCM 19046]
MKKRAIIIRLVFLCGAFYLYIMSLLHLVPFWLSIPLLMSSTILLFSPIRKKQRFRGYRSRSYKN